MLQLQPTPDCPTDNRCIEDRFLTLHHIHIRDKEVLELLTKSLAKSCDLDPLKSKLLVQHHQEVVPLLSHIVNVSGCFSFCLATSNLLILRNRIEFYVERQAFTSYQTFLRKPCLITGESLSLYIKFYSVPEN